MVIPHPSAAEDHRITDPVAGVSTTGDGDAAAVGDVDREKAAAWCGPVPAISAPTSAATAATPATAHTHRRGGRGQPPNSTTSDGTAHLSP